MKTYQFIWWYEEKLGSLQIDKRFLSWKTYFYMQQRLWIITETPWKRIIIFIVGLLFLRLPPRSCNEKCPILTNCELVSCTKTIISFIAACISFVYVGQCGKFKIKILERENCFCHHTQNGSWLWSFDPPEKRQQHGRRDAHCCLMLVTVSGSLQMQVWKK